MSEEHPFPQDRSEARLWVGGVASVVVVGIASIIVGVKWNATPPPSLGDWGSFIGGVVSAVALIWLVIGTRQQSEELRNQRYELAMQRQELTLQRKELAASVEAQTRQATATEESIRMALAAQDAAERDRVSRRPTFQHHSVSANDPNVTFSDLILSGGTALSVTAEAAAPGVKATALGETLQVPVGRVIRVQLEAIRDGGHFPPIPDEVVFSLMYLGESGERFVQRHRVSRSQSRTFPQPPTPVDV